VAGVEDYKDNSKLSVFNENQFKCRMLNVNKDHVEKSMVWQPLTLVCTGFIVCFYFEFGNLKIFFPKLKIQDFLLMRNVYAFLPV